LDYSKVREFIEEMEAPTIVYHKDADGVCSAALIQEITSGVAMPNDGPGINLSEGLLESLKESKSIVFLDIPVDQLSVVNELKEKKILVLDHHPPKTNLTKGDVLHVNPRFETPDSYLPASYLSYKIIDGGYENIAWKAGVGVVGDHGVEDCKDLLKKVKQENFEAVGGKKLTYGELKESKLGIIADMIDASKAVKGLYGIKRSYEIIKKSKKPNDVFKTELREYYETYQKHLGIEMDKFEREAEYFPETNSYMHEITSDYSLGSDLSTELSNKNPDAVIIVYQIESYGMKISGRCQSGRVNVSDIIQKAVADHGSGGGHPQAAGGFVKKGKEKVALERFRELLEGLN